MPLDKNGCTDSVDLQNWYHYIFEHEGVQEKLLNISDRSSFSSALESLAKEHRFSFSKQALNETFSDYSGGWSEEELIENGIEDKWVRKIMIMGWAPIGYTR